MEDGSRHSVSCWKIGCVSEMSFFTWDHFRHRESAVNCVNIKFQKIQCRCPPIWTIFHQLLSFIYSSTVSWWWAMDIAWASPATSSKWDHKVSSISPSTCPAWSIKFRLYLGKQSGIWVARCHFPIAPVISKESESSKNFDLETHSQKWMIHWQHMSYMISALTCCGNHFRAWQIE